MVLHNLIGEKFTSCHPTFLNVPGFLDERFTDVIVKVSYPDCESQCYRLHRNVLAGCSFYLHKSFEQAQTLDITFMSPTEFELLITFIYTGNFHFKSVAELCVGLYAANLFEINNLSSKCFEGLREKLKNDCRDALLILKMDERFSSRVENAALFELVDEIIKKNYRVIISSEVIEELDIDTMKYLLQMDPIYGVAEIEIFNAMTRWVDAQCRRKEIERVPEKMQEVAGDLVYQIRFNLMQESMFAREVVKTGLLSDRMKILVFERYHNEQLDVPFCTQARHQGKPLIPQRKKKFAWFKCVSNKRSDVSSTEEENFKITHKRKKFFPRYKKNKYESETEATYYPPVDLSNDGDKHEYYNRNNNHHFYKSSKRKSSSNSSSDENEEDYGDLDWNSSISNNEDHLDTVVKKSFVKSYKNLKVPPLPPLWPIKTTLKKEISEATSSKSNENLKVPPPPQPPSLPIRRIIKKEISEATSSKSEENLEGLSVFRIGLKWIPKSFSLKSSKRKSNSNSSSDENEDVYDACESDWNSRISNNEDHFDTVVEKSFVKLSTPKSNSNSLCDENKEVYDVYESVTSNSNSNTQDHADKVDENSLV